MNKKTKKSSPSSNLSLNTTKGRLIVTLLAFVVIGAGLYVYQTFAATASWTFTAGQQTLFAGANTPNSPCRTSAINIGDSKNPSPAFKIACTADTDEVSAARVLPKATAFDAPQLYKQYQMCARVNGRGTAKITMVMPNENPQSVTLEQETNFGAAGTGGSVRVCTPVGWATKAGSVTGSLIATKAGTSLSVSSMTLEEVALYGSTASTGASASTANPSPVK